MSKYFNILELTHSNTADIKHIDNTPNEEQLANLERLMLEILDPLREAYGSAILVNSGYRCPALNKAVGGSKGSNHLDGLAADLVPADGNTKRLFDTAKRLMDEKKIEVGQLIWEYGTKKKPKWVHIALPTLKHYNEVLYIGI